jgi:phytoene desaturase
VAASASPVGRPGVRPRPVVVGAGLGGLAAPIRLRAAGVDVTGLERQRWPGGRAGRLELDGYAFDAGPSVITRLRRAGKAARVGVRADEWPAGRTSATMGASHFGATR